MWSGSTGGSAAPSPPPLPRVVVCDVLSAEWCEELLVLYHAMAVVGYRPGVCSLTLHEMTALEPALLQRMVRACM